MTGSIAPASSPANPVDAEIFKAGMRCLASGVTIITTIHDGQRAGLTATAVCSLSVDPPQLLVCVSHKAEAHDIIHRGSVLCVNLLARFLEDAGSRDYGYDQP